MPTTPHEQRAIVQLVERIAVTTAGLTLPDPLPLEPFALFQGWFEQEQEARRTPNPNAMSLASVGAEGAPSSRIVLCRGIDARAGAVTFFTNYDGRKGRELLAHPRACATFHWDHTDRQVRIEGVAFRTTPAESDAYFASRRWESRLAAWVSDQSRPVASREALLGKLPAALALLGLRAEQLLADPERVSIPRPPHWGGFHLLATRAELWLGGPTRLHDRAQWTRSLRGDIADLPHSGLADALAHWLSGWSSTRIQP